MDYKNEIWKDVTGYEGYYQVSNLGRFRSLDREIAFSDGRVHKYKGKIINGSVGRDGYIDVKLSKNNEMKTRKLHRLIAYEFLNVDLNKSDLEVNHKDLNRQNNNVDNLEWITHKENVRHSAKLGSYKNKDGVNNGRATYSVQDVEIIRKMYDDGCSIMEIVKFFYPNLDYKQRKNKFSRISDIAKRKTFTKI